VGLTGNGRDGSVLWRRTRASSGSVGGSSEGGAVAGVAGPMGLPMTCFGVGE
jgi:hypothetical protein